MAGNIALLKYPPLPALMMPKHRFSHEKYRAVFRFFEPVRIATGRHSKKPNENNLPKNVPPAFEGPGKIYQKKSSLSCNIKALPRLHKTCLYLRVVGGIC